jgi:hypothetical protein
MSESEPPDQIPDHLQTVTMGGKWHEPERPAANAAYRLAYIFMRGSAAPSVVHGALREVFLASGLLDEDDCLRITQTAVRFARMDVLGTA